VLLHWYNSVKNYNVFKYSNVPLGKLHALPSLHYPEFQQAYKKFSICVKYCSKSILNLNPLLFFFRNIFGHNLTVKYKFISNGCMNVSIVEDHNRRGNLSIWKS
jgi:hypothetical protein